MTRVLPAVRCGGCTDATRLLGEVSVSGAVAETADCLRLGGAWLRWRNCLETTLRHIQLRGSGILISRCARPAPSPATSALNHRAHIPRQRSASAPAGGRGRGTGARGRVRGSPRVRADLAGDRPPRGATAVPARPRGDPASSGATLPPCPRLHVLGRPRARARAAPARVASSRATVGSSAGARAPHPPCARRASPARAPLRPRVECLCVHALNASWFVPASPSTGRSGAEQP